MTPFILSGLVLKNAEKRFTKVPDFIKERIDAEINLLQEERQAHFDVEVGDYGETYELLKCLLAKNTNKTSYIIDGYDNGNLCLSYFLGLSDVLPVYPFYYCSKCGYYEVATKNVLAGYSLPIKACPECGNSLRGSGLHILLPDKIGNLTYNNQLGLKVSIGFLKRNHLNLAHTFKLPRYRRGIATFVITVEKSHIQFQYDNNASILEYVLKHYNIDFESIDYNDFAVYQTLFSENRYALGLVGSSLQKTLPSFPDFNNTFDDWIRLMGLHSITFRGASVPKEVLNENAQIQKYALPLFHEDIAQFITKFNIDFDLDYSVLNGNHSEKEGSIDGQGVDSHNLANLVSYIQKINFAPRKCATFHKALTAYRIAYLRTYHRDMLDEAIKALGFQDISKREFKRIVKAYLWRMDPKDQSPKDYLVKHLPAAFDYYYDEYDPVFISKINECVNE